MTRRAVFLDRDGVINRAVVRNGKPHPPANPDELEILPGVPEALKKLRAAGFRLIVVTNQPDVARGIQTREGVEAIHRAILKRVDLDEFRICFHDDSDGCRCRKPAPGLLLDAALGAGADLKASFLIGDRWRDIEAGRQAGCATVFVDHGYVEPRPLHYNVRVGSLSEAADWILAQSPGDQ